MLAPVLTATELVTGEQMTVEEFLRCWEELPGLKNAELIDGVVHVSSPVSREHGNLDTLIHWWLAHYSQATPGCQAGNNSTWLMLDSAPQPDAHLRILPSHGGQSGDARLYCTGAPELAVEICLTSTEVDFGPKRKLYQKAGVREYITIELFWKRMVWRVLENGAYIGQTLPSDGIVRSQVFPGLWLDEAAFWAEDGAKMLAALNAGLASEDHQKFVARLAAAK
ncbi:MAG TPA: Uma2 family endonuclease [Bryobacteraceae bacterium]|nr:Uma2 family endonuclease [Bryobacteraceae bacterium]